jgi:hypothetical protein
MHRVDVASVQLPRSTAAEATACRESLQPSALRARCNRKAIRHFMARQPMINAFVRKLRHSCLRRHLGRRRADQGVDSPRKLPVHAKMHRDRLASVRSPDRPPPKRLPLGGPSTSGAPSSVQLGDYGLPEAPSRSPTTQMPLFATFSLQTAHTCAESHVLYLKRTKDSPSRVRFRPLPRLTFRFRVQPFGRASS